MKGWKVNLIYYSSDLIIWKVKYPNVFSIDVVEYIKKYHHQEICFSRPKTWKSWNVPAKICMDKHGLKLLFLFCTF